MASSVHKDGVNYSGFSQTAMKQERHDSLGSALNEGYTELLTERYFNHGEEARGTIGDYEAQVGYIFERSIASKLEKIVGQEKMESLYLNANLPGLINELKNYASEEEIMKFISKTDFLSKHLRSTNPLPFEKEMAESSLKDTTEFLLKAYIMKMKKHLDRGELDANSFTDALATYISSFSPTLTIPKKFRNREYKFLTPEILKESLAVLNDPALTANLSETVNEHPSKGK